MAEGSYLEGLIEDNEGEEILSAQASNITSMFGSAIPITCGTSYTVSPGEVPCYKLTTAAGRLYTFESVSDSDEDDCDPYIRIFSANGELIGADDDGSAGVNFYYQIAGGGAVYYVIPSFYYGKVAYSFSVTDEENTNNYQNDFYNNSQAGIWQISPKEQDAVLYQTITLKAGWTTPGDVIPQFTWWVNEVEQTVKGDSLELRIENEGDTDVTVSMDGYSVETWFGIYVPHCDHEMGPWAVSVPATALQPGTEARTCIHCGMTETRGIPQLPAFIQLNVSGKLPMKVKQKTNKVVATLQSGDYVTSWTSSNTKVVKVSSNGALSAQKKTGKATITAVTAAGQSASFVVVVQKKPVKTSKVAVATKSLSLVKGQTFNLMTVATPITNQDKITYSVSKKGVVKVSKGVITAKKKGKTVVTVKSGKKKVKVKVTVK